MSRLGVSKVKNVMRGKSMVVLLNLVLWKLQQLNGFQPYARYRNIISTLDNPRKASRDSRHV